MSLDLVNLVIAALFTVMSATLALIGASEALGIVESGGFPPPLVSVAVGTVGVAYSGRLCVDWWQLNGP
jgi:hypothetical protein